MSNRNEKLTSRDLAQQRTRATLLSTAAKLVAEKGFGGVSIGDIAEAAGFTKGAFYSNFDSRDAMLLELLREVHLGQRTTMDKLQAETVPSLEDALDQLAEIVTLHVNSPVASLLVGEVQLQARRNPDFATRARAGFEEQLRAFAGWIERVLKSAKRRPALPPRELARTIMALSQGLSQQPADRAAVKAMVRQVIEQLFVDA